MLLYVLKRKDREIQQNQKLIQTVHTNGTIPQSIRNLQVLIKIWLYIDGMMHPILHLKIFIYTLLQKLRNLGGMTYRKMMKTKYLRKHLMFLLKENGLMLQMNTPQICIIKHYIVMIYQHLMIIHETYTQFK
jgi:hypothetical protein